MIKRGLGKGVGGEGEERRGGRQEERGGEGRWIMIHTRYIMCEIVSKYSHYISCCISKQIRGE
jgi:hypothetical protein